MDTKALVTGGAGFIGSNLALHLESLGAEVTVLDNLASGSPTNLKDFGGRVIDGEVVEAGALLEDLHLDVIFHQAAVTDTTVLDREAMFRTNVEGFRQVLEIASARGAKVIYASSAAVYGAQASVISESAPLKPLNPYGESKVAAEDLALEYARRAGLVVVGLRYFNVFGPREGHKTRVASMIWQLAVQMAGGTRPRMFKWGEQKRDHIYVMDVLDANVKALALEESGVFNVGTGAAVSFNEIVGELNRVLDLSYEPEYFDNPYSFFQEHTQADTALATEQLGFTASYDVRAGMDEYFSTVNLKETVRQV